MNPSILPGDSMHYQMLYDAAKTIKGIPGVTLEIGLRRGGGTEAIVRGLVDNADKRVHMAIDPYGNVPYKAGTSFTQYDYTNSMRMEALAGIYQWCKEQEIVFTYWPLADTDFFRAFPDGPPFYDNGTKIATEFALVHFDGPHGVEEVNEEVRYFSRFAPLGSVWVFDDTNMYEHFTGCDPLIQECGFGEIQVSEDKRRAWYQKTRPSMIG